MSTSHALLLAALLLSCDLGSEPSPDAAAEGSATPSPASRAAASSSDRTTHATTAALPSRATKAASPDAPPRAEQADAPAGEPTPADANEADTEPETLVLRRPPMPEPTALGRYVSAPETAPGRIAQAYQFDAPVFRSPTASRPIAGLVRRNTRIAVDRYVPGPGCDKSWYALVGGGFVCSGEGFAVGRDPAPLPEPLQIEPPDVDRPLPYRYAKVRTPAPLYWRLPTEDELRTGSSSAIRGRAEGAHFVAMDQTVTVGETTLHRTVRGFYIRDEDLEAKPAPTMHGEHLSGAQALPLAFVHVDEATLLDPDTGAERGTAERFARFAVASEDERDGTPRVLARDGFAVARDSVRVARTYPRPEEVGAHDQWIHIDLEQQVLVAYEGDAPVLATLVSSGKEGFEPPLGVFRVHKKYTTVTMEGPDPDAGTYAVEQVPWTMYYWGSFALHGAYWHDTFGNVRSHGCTNLPPADARWLFYWSAPTLPEGWHAQVGLRGPWVVFTRGSAETDPSPSARSAAP